AYPGAVRLLRLLILYIQHLSVARQEAVFLFNSPRRGLFGRLPRFLLALRQGDFAEAVADEQHFEAAFGPTVHDAARRLLRHGPPSFLPNPSETAKCAAG